MEFLRRAHEEGTFLIVGIHSDEAVNKVKGRNYPIMNLPERVFGLLSCKFVDDIIIGAPWEVTDEMIETYHIQKVVHGLVDSPKPEDVDCYKVPKSMGIYKEIDSGSKLTSQEIMKRVEDAHALFEERNKKKFAAGCK